MTFTVAYLNEVDSFNPFLGIEASSFEMWSLMYDSLTGYAMEDMQPDAGAGHRVGDLRRRPHLDVHDPRRRHLVRRRAADRPGRPLHLRADPRRRAGAGDLGRLPEGRRVGDRARRHHHRPGARAAERAAAAAPDPDRAGARVERRLRRRDEELRQRAHGRRAGRRLRPVPARRGHRGRLDVPLRGQPRLLGRHAAPRRGRLPRLQVRGPRDPGAHHRRGRLRRGHQRAPGPVARGPRRDQRPDGRLPGLRRDRLQHGFDRHQDRRADR